MTSNAIQDFGLEKYCPSAGRDLLLKRLKQRGFLLFHMTTGSSIFSPAALVKKLW